MSTLVLLSLSLDLGPDALAEWRGDALDNVDPRWPGASEAGEPVATTVDEALVQARQAGLQIEDRPSGIRIAGRLDEEQWPVAGAGVLAAMERGVARGGRSRGVIALMPEGDVSVVALSGTSLEVRAPTDDEAETVWALLAATDGSGPTNARPLTRSRARGARDKGVREIRTFGATVTTLARCPSGRLWCAESNVWWSDDEGEQWTQAKAPPGYPRAFLEDTRGLLVAGFRLPLTLSTDGGASYRRVEAPRMGERYGIARVDGGIVAFGEAPTPVVWLADGEASARALEMPVGFDVYTAARIGENLLLLGKRGGAAQVRGGAVEQVESSTKLDLLTATVDDRGRLWAVTSRSVVRAVPAPGKLAWKTVKTPATPWSVAAWGSRVLLGARDGLYELGEDDATWTSRWKSEDVVRCFLVLPSGKMLATTQAGRLLEVRPR